MELQILDTNLELANILDVFESLIWADRFCGFGDFEILVSAESPSLLYMTKDSYLSLKDSEHLMIVENSSLHTDVETGGTVTVKGRSLESILERRIVWNQTVLTGNFQTAIHRLLNENAIFPSAPTSPRRITRLEFITSSDPIITALTVDDQFYGEILYNAILDLCNSVGIGFKITLGDNGNFQFELYSGTDHSYAQLSNPYVIFSPKFNNIISTDYKEDNTSLKTVTLVAGEGQGSDRITTTVEIEDGAGSDLDRREIFTDAKSVSKTVAGGEPLSDQVYITNLKQKGTETLSKNVEIQTFEGAIDNTHAYVYNDEFSMGDVVEVEDEYGHEATSRVTEFIYSQDQAGTKMYPTFSAI